MLQLQTRRHKWLLLATLAVGLAGMSAVGCSDKGDGRSVVDAVTTLDAGSSGDGVADAAVPATHDGGVVAGVDFDGGLSMVRSCTASALSASGVVSNSVADIDYARGKVQAVVRHRIDADAGSDGCVAKASFVIEREGGGCVLSLLFSTVKDGFGGLGRVRLDADGSCPGFSNDTKGVFEAETGYGAWWYLGPRDVEQPMAAGVCIVGRSIGFPDAPIVLRRTSSGASGASLTVNLKGLRLEGDIFSSGDATETCAVATDCAAGLHDGGAGWCVPAGSCTPGFHDNGAGDCVASGCVSTHVFCNGACHRESPENCGASCAVCPAPASNAVATCENAQCRVSCRDGYAVCSNACVSLTTPTNCGACGVVCDGECSTGQCKPDHEWTLWPLPAEAPPTAGYVVTEDTVTDTVTRLAWQRVVKDVSHSWENAKKYCASLSLAGGGWRLPTRIELLSIVDRRRDYPTINTSVFSPPPRWPTTVWFWTATPYVSTKNGVWVVTFDYGTTTDANSESERHLVRCVR